MAEINFNDLDRLGNSANKLNDGLEAATKAAQKLRAEANKTLTVVESIFEKKDNKSLSDIERMIDLLDDLQKKTSSSKFEALGTGTFKSIQGSIRMYREAAGQMLEEKRKLQQAANVVITTPTGKASGGATDTVTGSIQKETANVVKQTNAVKGQTKARKAKTAAEQSNVQAANEGNKVEGQLTDTVVKGKRGRKRKDAAQNADAEVKEETKIIEQQAADLGKQKQARAKVKKAVQENVAEQNKINAIPPAKSPRVKLPRSTNPEKEPYLLRQIRVSERAQARLTSSRPFPNIAFSNMLKGNILKNDQYAANALELSGKMQLDERVAGKAMGILIDKIKKSNLAKSEFQGVIDNMATIWTTPNLKSPNNVMLQMIKKFGADKEVFKGFIAKARLAKGVTAENVSNFVAGKSQYVDPKKATQFKKKAVEILAQQGVERDNLYKSIYQYMYEKSGEGLDDAAATKTLKRMFKLGGKNTDKSVSSSIKNHMDKAIVEGDINDIPGLTKSILHSYRKKMKPTGESVTGERRLSKADDIIRKAIGARRGKVHLINEVTQSIGNGAEIVDKARDTILTLEGKRVRRIGVTSKELSTVKNDILEVYGRSNVALDKLSQVITGRTKEAFTEIATLLGINENQINGIFGNLKGAKNWTKAGGLTKVGYQGALKGLSKSGFLESGPSPLMSNLERLGNIPKDFRPGVIQRLSNDIVSSLPSKKGAKPETILEGLSKSVIPPASNFTGKTPGVIMPRAIQPQWEFFSKQSEGVKGGIRGFIEAQIERLMQDKGSSFYQDIAQSHGVKFANEFAKKTFGFSKTAKSSGSLYTTIGGSKLSEMAPLKHKNIDHIWAPDEGQPKPHEDTYLEALFSGNVFSGKALGELGLPEFMHNIMSTGKSMPAFFGDLVKNLPDVTQSTQKYWSRPGMWQKKGGRSLLTGWASKVKKDYMPLPIHPSQAGLVDGWSMKVRPKLKPAYVPLPIHPSQAGLVDGWSSNIARPLGGGIPGSPIPFGEYATKARVPFGEYATKARVPFGEEGAKIVKRWTVPLADYIPIDEGAFVPVPKAPAPPIAPPAAPSGPYLPPMPEPAMAKGMRLYAEIMRSPLTRRAKAGLGVQKHGLGPFMDKMRQQAGTIMEDAKGLHGGAMYELAPEMAMDTAIKNMRQMYSRAMKRSVLRGMKGDWGRTMRRSVSADTITSFLGEGYSTENMHKLFKGFGGQRADVNEMLKSKQLLLRPQWMKGGMNEFMGGAAKASVAFAKENNIEIEAAFTKVIAARKKEVEMLLETQKALLDTGKAGKEFDDKMRHRLTGSMSHMENMLTGPFGAALQRLGGIVPSSAGGFIARHTVTGTEVGHGIGRIIGAGPLHLGNYLSGVLGGGKSSVAQSIFNYQSRRRERIMGDTGEAPAGGFGAFDKILGMTGKLTRGIAGAIPFVGKGIAELTSMYITAMAAKFTAMVMTAAKLFQGALHIATSAISKFASVISGVVGSAFSIVKGGVITAGVAGVAALGKGIYNWGQEERSRIGLGVVARGNAGGMTRLAENMAAKSMFTKRELIDGIKQGLAFGLSPQQVTKFLPKMANAAALFGEDIGFGLRALSRAAFQAEPEAAERYGLNLYEKNLKQLFGNLYNLNDPVQKAEATLKAAEIQLNKFAFGLEKALLTVSGSFTMLRNRMDEMMTSLGEGFSGGFGLAKRTTSLAKSFGSVEVMDALRNIGNLLGTQAATQADKLSGYMPKDIKDIKAFLTTEKEPDSKWSGYGDIFRASLKPVIDQMEIIFKAASKKWEEIFGDKGFLGTIQELIDDLRNNTDWTELRHAIVNGFFDAMRALSQAINDAFVSGAKTIGTEFIKNLPQMVKDYSGTMVETFRAIIENIPSLIANNKDIAAALTAYHFGNMAGGPAVGAAAAATAYYATTPTVVAGPNGTTTQGPSPLGSIWNWITNNVPQMYGPSNGMYVPGVSPGMLPPNGKIPSYDVGTPSVPGPDGKPQLAIVHGGEKIIPVDQVKALDSQVKEIQRQIAEAGQDVILTDDQKQAMIKKYAEAVREYIKGYTGKEPWSNAAEQAAFYADPPIRPLELTEKERRDAIYLPPVDPRYPVPPGYAIYGTGQNAMRQTASGILNNATSQYNAGKRPHDLYTSAANAANSKIDDTIGKATGQWPAAKQYIDNLLPKDDGKPKTWFDWFSKTLDSGANLLGEKKNINQLIAPEPSLVMDTRTRRPRKRQNIHLHNYALDMLNGMSGGSEAAKVEKSEVKTGSLMARIAAMEVGLKRYEEENKWLATEQRDRITPFGEKAGAVYNFYNPSINGDPNFTRRNSR